MSKDCETYFLLSTPYSGVSKTGEEAKFVRIATNIALHITLASSEDTEATAGRILPPYMVIEYETVSQRDKRMALSFQVIYHADILQVRLMAQRAGRMIYVMAKIIC